MSELLNWYIEELRQQLASKIPAVKLDNILREAESHLIESARNRISGQADERVAMENAINAYGLPKKVALTYLRRIGRRVLGMRPIYASLLGCFVAIFCWNFHWATLDTYFDNFGEAWQNVLAGVVGFFALSLIIAAARAGYRSYWGAITLFTVAVAVISIPVVSFWMVGSTFDSQGISRFHLSRDTAKVQAMVGKIEKAQAFLDKGMATWKLASDFHAQALSPEVEKGLESSKAANSPITFDAANSLPADLRDSRIAAAELGEVQLSQGPNEVEDQMRDFRIAREVGGRQVNRAALSTAVDRDVQFPVPREFGAFAMVRGDLYAFETVKKYEDAEKAWANFGPIIGRGLTREHADMLGLLRSAEQARSGRLFFFNKRLYEEIEIGTLWLIPLFLLIDGFAAASAKPRRAWPKPRLA